MIGFYDGADYAVFRDIGSFLDHVCRKKYRGWRVFAHYGGRFDVGFIFDYLLTHRPETNFTLIAAGSAVIGLTIISENGRYRWRFCDSFRLMPTSLKKLTHDFDVQHKKLDFDQTSVEYNRHDCIGLYEVLDYFYGMFGERRETVASQAMAVYRRHFLSIDLHVPPRSVERFCRTAYYGGRCELYRFDEHIVNAYDVNSLYPRAMTEPVPVRYLSACNDLNERDDRIGFYEARIRYPERYLPVLPVRYPVTHGRLYFPVGEFRGIWTDFELRRAIEDGADVRIIRGRLFDAEPALADYAREIYRMKIDAEREHKGGARWVAKFLLNSLYGKFGQRREQICYVRDFGQRGVFPVGGGIAWYGTVSRARHILPHIAATVTARARLITHDFLSSAEPPYYTDTDSIYTPSQLPIGEALGELHYEGRGMFEGYGLKEYRFDGSYKIKGIHKEDKETAEAFIRGETITQERQAGVLESVRDLLPSVRRVSYGARRRARVEKRARGGWDTRPWRYSEITAADDDAD